MNAKLNTDVLDQAEADLFKNAIEQLEAKPKSRKAKGDKPAVSKYAAKQESFKQEAAVEPVVDVEPVRQAPVSVSSDFLSGLEVDLFGETTAAMEEMLSLREEGFALINRAKAINVRDLELKARRDAREWENRVPKDAARRIFEELGESNDHKSRLMLDVLNELREQFNNTKGGDPFKRQKYIDIVMAALMRDPIMKEKHEANMARAEAIMQDYEARVAEQNTLYAQGAEKLDLANILAEENGWPKTAPKGGDASHK